MNGGRSIFRICEAIDAFADAIAMVLVLEGFFFWRATLKFTEQNGCNGYL
jgi:hypothetical protein